MLWISFFLIMWFVSGCKTTSSQISFCLFITANMFRLAAPLLVSAAGLHDEMSLVHGATLVDIRVCRGSSRQARSNCILAATVKRKKWRQSTTEENSLSSVTRLTVNAELPVNFPFACLSLPTCSALRLRYWSQQPHYMMRRPAFF